MTQTIEAIPLQSLGYVGINTDNLAQWLDFGPQLLGLQVAERAAKRLTFRMDDWASRMQVEDNGKTGLQYIGWEVADNAALQALAAHLTQHTIDVHSGSRSLVEQRGVADLIWVHDPAGNRLEFFYAAKRADSRFCPGRNIAGFRTGTLGLGHVVLMCERLDMLLPFYTDVLGFRVSDYVQTPFRATFLHINARHHSLALVEFPRSGVHHLMLELLQLDDVGHAWDLAQQRGERIGVTLGRHSNDYMLSFYTESPSKFMVEIGWGGRQIQPEGWQPVELTQGPSNWGHNRTWLGEEANALARAQQRRNAELGLRHPVPVFSEPTEYGGDKNENNP